ncbi:hypothetical protein DL95DRAFT_469592 [Leptodontidium sp. 2 PMI_412]|nr:hypothetical protein DL95DRAFT_469592 [Leptodontidium sp. 2 PMI_412]
MNDSNPPLNKRIFEEVAPVSLPGSTPTFHQQLRTWCVGREYLSNGDGGENTFVGAMTADLEAGVEVGSVEAEADVEAKTDTEDSINLAAEAEDAAADFAGTEVEAVDDTRININSAVSTKWAKAWTDAEDKDGESRKRRKIGAFENPPGAIWKKILYVDSTTFNTEFRAYSQLAASSSPYPISHVIESVLLPQPFLNKQRVLGNKYDARVFTPYRCGLILQHFSGPLLCEFLEVESD